MRTSAQLFLLAAVLAACGVSTPTDSRAPTGNPSPTGSPRSTGSPSPTTQSSPTRTFTADQISHPTGSADLILQAELTGGFVPPDFIVTQMPYFSLYGDGTVIIRPNEERAGPLPPGALPRLLVAQLSEEQIQALLGFALGEGRLLAAKEHYPQNSCADCASAIFRIDAAGVDKTVTVDAPGVEEQMDPIDRRGFVALADTLASFERRALAGELGEVELYDPSHYLVALLEAQPGQGDPVAWPWPDVSLDDFTAQGDATWRRDAALTREQVARVTQVPSGGAQSIFIEDEHGSLWSVALRPLLPDEIAELTTAQ